MDANLREGLLLVADSLCHMTLDPYINAEVRGRHLPGWGQIQLWQHYLCEAYEHLAAQNLAEAEQRGREQQERWRQEAES